MENDKKKWLDWGLAAVSIIFALFFWRALLFFWTWLKAPGGDFLFLTIPDWIALCFLAALFLFLRSHPKVISFGSGVLSEAKRVSWASWNDTYRVSLLVLLFVGVSVCLVSLIDIVIGLCARFGGWFLYRIGL